MQNILVREKNAGATAGVPTAARRRSLTWRLGAIALLAASLGAAAPATVPLRAEMARTLAVLTDTLTRLQCGPETGVEAGALRCPHCRVLHTRAAEAVWPFALQFAETGEERFLHSLRALAQWLFRQQQPDGSWKETPEEWTGTTTDQLLMLVLAYQQVSSSFTPAERAAWLQAIENSADYLVRVMSPEFASINYCATTTASLAATHALVPKPVYLEKARRLAHQTIARMDEEGFLNGEGGKTHNLKMGVDLGYSLEMSFWGLALYDRLAGDWLVRERVLAALEPHLHFIYPDGMMDGSWGIRSNKWTTYGSATSDGCQVLFTLFADLEHAGATAAWRNLEFLRTCIRDGFVTYGPHHAEVMREPPCIYPTFAKAKNLALAMKLETKPERPLVPLPGESTGWQRYFPTINVVTTRTRAFMATTTAYGYTDIAKGPDSKYMFRPTGGAMSCLWLEGHGLVQASSQTEYHRWEPMHFPEADGLKPLTPRIEYGDGKNYFTNLFEFAGRLATSSSRPGAFLVSTAGDLKDRNWHFGGVSYRLTHTLRDDAVRKDITLFYRGASPTVTIVEPIVHHPGMTFHQVDARTAEIHAPTSRLRFRIAHGGASLSLGRQADKYWSPYPALRAYPLELTVPPPDKLYVLQQSVAIELTVLRR